MSAQLRQAGKPGGERRDETLRSFLETRYQVEQWMRWYSEARSHQAPGYPGLVEYRQHQLISVA
jgi:hypothetical protein